DRKRKSEEERRDESDAFRSVAGGEDGPPSKNSLVTMNGPNESRGPIKDYSRRRSAPTTLGHRLDENVRQRQTDRQRETERARFGGRDIQPTIGAMHK
ncbi:hypothetical protein X777_10842, partial [Ooceraea biroi]